MTKAALQELNAMDRLELAKKWEAVFGVPAPRFARESLLRGAIAWKIQADALGGLSLIEKRQLESRSSDTKSSSSPTTFISPGSRLIRVWQNQTHQVTVLETGYLYEGRIWKSLSKLAQHITGTAWSGPVFFGLKKPCNRRKPNE